MNKGQDWSEIELLEPRAMMSATLQVTHNALAATTYSQTNTGGKAASIGDLGNDSSDQLTITNVTQGMHGSVKINPDNTVTYSPLSMFIGSDSFAYTISNSARETAVGRVTVVVSSSKPAPTPGAHGSTRFPSSHHADTTSWPTFDLITAAKATGHLNFRLAFIVTPSTDQPCLVDHHNTNSNVTPRRASGGDVSISFGGTSGVELADAIASVSETDAA